MLPDEYLDKITSAHISRPRFMEWLASLLELVCAAGNVAGEMDLAFYVGSAAGAQLDMIGAIVGISRVLPFASEYTEGGIMEDSEYRSAILAKILRNQWDGTNESLPLLWQAVYPSLQMMYTDNQDMTIDVTVTGTISNTLSEMIQAGMIVPVPAGVGVSYTIYNSDIEPAELGMDGGLFEYGNDDFVRQGTYEST